ncbi:YggN family protein [Pseudoalteromonas ruthenica]|uniref:YggN family protein n=1 Tax=Pseudoalteromonas ruthenica TaxID=151081 RepID=UPI00110C1037|nr:YggN family protein [Pseudoalteromonas ruthenica]TMO44336.1 hypothetical protein CWC24_14525 [Pseudoalteromonas ruthenica]TMO51533.1 hypothetical protein CWC23_06285 [Pseudoalteromonas ruthenica]
MKTTAALLFASMTVTTSALAHEQKPDNLSFGSQQCDIEFKSDIRINPERIQITNVDNQHMVYDGQQLLVDGEVMPLTAAQQQALDNYSQQLRSYVPEVAQIALDGVKIAGVAIEEVSAAFGIEHNNALQQVVDNIGNNIEHSFYQNGEFVMGKQSFDELGEDIEQQFDENFEQAVEQAMVQSIGSVLMALGSQMVSSGGDMDEFEQRMERMGEQIEQRVELQAANIEQRADALCQSFSELAEQEAQLVSMVPELSDFQLLITK